MYNGIIPAEIALGKQKTDLNQNRITFGSYEKVYIGTKKNMKRRSATVIALMSLTSGKDIIFCHCTQVKST